VDINGDNDVMYIRICGLGLYTILPSPILHGIWHAKGGLVVGRVLRNRRAIVLQ